MNKLTTERFIEKARKIHNNKFDYSKVEYVNSRTKVCIICPEHGEFWQTPNSHLNGQGCPSCSKTKKIITETFIEKAKQIHGNKYDYSKVEYKNNSTKVCIVCPDHGEFWQRPGDHLMGHGCPKCKGEIISKLKKSNKIEFIEQAKQIHGDKYGYSKVEYVNNRTKVCIICPEHGEFWQTPNSHLSGQGCPSCGKTKKLTTETFIEKAKQIHGDKYDYSKVEYVNSRTKVCIICPEHGEFWQRPGDHIGQKQGCKKCCKVCDSIEQFIEKARKIHGDKYDYSKVEYVNNKTKVCINCPEHGEFWQTPLSHLSGRGCKKCKESKGERAIDIILKENNLVENVDFIREFKTEWLNKQHLDFYFPKIKIAVEYDGEQHFHPVKFNGISENKARELFEKTKVRDEEKNNKCSLNGIRLIRISYKDYNNIEKILKEENII